jgi:hypothetical protein
MKFTAFVYVVTLTSTGIYEQSVLQNITTTGSQNLLTRPINYKIMKTLTETNFADGPITGQQTTICGINPLPQYT